MTYMAFTKKFDDNSTEQGFEFVFYCDISGEPVRTKFIESKTGSKAEKTRVIGKGILSEEDSLKVLELGFQVSHSLILEKMLIMRGTGRRTFEKIWKDVFTVA